MPEIADFLEIDSSLIRKIYKEIYVKYERICNFRISKS
jgi:hypothetical protein